MNASSCRLLAVGSALLMLGTSGRLQAQPKVDTPITILQTTDVHHHANGADHVGLDVDPVTAMGATGAYGRISTYVNYVRATAKHPVILVDSGDWTMGTLYDLTLSSRPLALQFLDSMKYDCVTLGNHEFDYAPQGLAVMLGSAQSAFAFHTPIVASNMNLHGSPDLTPFVGSGKAIQTTRTEDLPNGLRVGYIGLMGKAATADAPVTAPVTFTDFSANYAAIQSMVDNLRNSQGAQVVVVLSHSGTNASGTDGEDVALASHVHGIDVIASGHTHTPLASAHAVTNGSWTTQIIDAGAFGSNVSRIDLTYHPSSNSTTLDASANQDMTDAGLSAVYPGLSADPAMVAAVSAADQQLNKALGGFLKTAFADYDPASLAKGIYHPVGSAAQNMASNEQEAAPSPNGLGDLAADGMRAVPNALLSQTLAAVGGNPANLPGYDFTPFQVSVVATGVLRNKLLSGAVLNFADLYNVLPLGATPDTTQALQVGFPMVSVYLEQADVKTLCALQLLTQSGLVPADYYLNFSGLRYALKPAESYTYFKYATAAQAVQIAAQKGLAGDSTAATALLAVIAAGQDNGAALLAAYAADNQWAAVFLRLNDVNPTSAQIAVNLGVLGEVATAALTDATTGTNYGTALLVSKAIAAIGTLSGFAIPDAANVGTATDITGPARVRVATDLFAVLALNQVQGQFGINVTAYKSATGTAAVSGGDFATILANRINATPGGGVVQELKEWMALLSYVQGGLKGSITSAYASTPDFTRFAIDGPAVQTRSQSYPVDSIAQMVGTVGSLTGAPPCRALGTPSIATVTNGSYGSKISAGGSIIVWGTGLDPNGGNALRVSRIGGPDTLLLDGNSGLYFWNLAPNQLNAALPAQVTAGEWVVSIRNSCGVESTLFAVSVR